MKIQLDANEPFEVNGVTQSYNKDRLNNPYHLYITIMDQDKPLKDYIELVEHISTITILPEDGGKKVKFNIIATDGENQGATYSKTFDDNNQIINLTFVIDPKELPVEE